MSLTTNNPELFWDLLLANINERMVVPVIGPELLTVQSGGHDRLLYELLAERLAKKLRLEGPTPASLHEVACQFLDNQGPINDLYTSLKLVMPPPEELPIPEPLLQLAGIRSFQLFVTTTFDPLLVRALDQVRFGGRPRTRVFAYKPSEPQDIPEIASGVEGPIVYHLFGKLSPMPDYAVTEEDVLEFVHSLQLENRRPPNLFYELTRKDLLVLGGSLPDWLARFFVRIAKPDRLSVAYGKTDFLVDTQIPNEAGLVLFLQRFSKGTKVFQGGGPVELVAELSRRWNAQNPSTLLPEIPESDPRSMPEGSVFISYAHEDRDAAEAIREALEQAHVDVWLDRTDLQPGDPWEQKILKHIDKCSMFIPLLSHHVLTPEHRFFRAEWDHADYVSHQAPPAMHFIVPVAIDDIPESSENLPTSFLKAQWMRLPNGKPTPELVSTLRQYFRDYQKSFREFQKPQVAS